MIPSARKIIEKAMILFVLLLTASCLVFAAYAEDNVAYVSASSGNDSGNGSANAPFKTLSRAIEELKYSGGTVVLTDKYTLSEGREVVDSIPRYTAPSTFQPIVITSVYGGNDYRDDGASLHFADKSAYLLGGTTTFENMTVTSDATDAYIAGCFNKLTFGDGFATEYTRNKEGRFLYAIGGYFAPAERNLPADRDTYITINSGNFKKVIGFTHVKGIATYTFTGTSHIVVNGGNINELFGASNYNHYSGSCDITVNYGDIKKLYAAGDATRRLDKNANIKLYDGTVGEVLINNVMGNVDILLDAADVRKMGVSYGSDALKKAAYTSVISLRYNSVIYSKSVIDSFTGITNIENYGNVYVAEGGTGMGKSELYPAGDINAALALVADGGGTVVILGDYHIGDFTEISRNGNVTITGQHGDKKGGKLILSGRYTVSGESTFENIAIEGAGNAVIDGGGNSLCIGDGVTTAGDISICGLYASSDADSGKNADVTIKSGTFAKVCGFDGNSVKLATAKVKVYGGNIAAVFGNANGGECDSAYIAVSGGEIGSVASVTGDAKTAEMTAEISGGNVGKVELAGVTGNLILRYAGGTIGSVALSGNSASSLFRYNEINVDSEAAKALGKDFASCEGEKTVFVADGGNGNGLSAEMPVGTLDRAFAILKQTGGKAVIVGKLTVNTGLLLQAAKGEVTITSVNDGVDYIAKGAMIDMGGNIAFSSDVTIENIAIETTEENVNFVFNGNKGHIGEGVISTCSPNVTKYAGIIAGSNTGEAYSSNLTVDSGIWNDLIGGHSVTGIYNRIKFDITVNGGEFYGKVVACGRGKQSGTFNLTLNGGTFYSGVYASTTSGEDERVKGTVTFDVNGGIFYGKIAPATKRTSIVNGTYTVNLSGGDFSHLTDIIGNELYAGTAESTLNVAEGFDPNIKPTGTFTWTNPLRRMADPRIILVDGLYYYVYTTGSVLSVYKAANIPDLAYSVGEPVWDAREVKDYLEGRDEYIWPSKLMYYSPEEFGENSGWYLLFTTYKPYEDANGNVQGDDRRSYILKSATNDLQGDWVNPETGEKNIPAYFSSDTYDWVNNTDWTAGQTTFRHEGKNYCLWIEQRGRGTADFAQRVYLSEMKNPWTVTGEILELIVPEYDWEREGFGYSSSEKQWYPAVIEGLTPVHNANGDLFVVYAGSGYWTPGYCLGQMTFKGGDILAKENWVKNPTPIFKKNTEVCGVGGPSIITTPDGKTDYLLYHAYLGADTTGYRYCFMEPYYVDETGFHVGQNNSPSPLSTEFSIEVNSMPVFDKISGFDTEVGIDTSVEPIVDPPAIGDPAQSGNNTVIIIIAIVGIAAAAAAVIVIIGSRKKKQP